MDYQPNNENMAKPGRSLPKPTIKIVENMLQQGKTCEETAKLAGLRKQTVVDIRKQMEVDGKMELGSWKREVTNLLGEFAMRGAKRLTEEVDNMPIGQMMMAVAIAVDKVRDLSEAPTVKVEARLKITQDDLNKAFLPSAKPIEIIDVEAQKPLDDTPPPVG
jgi:DNA-binding XRE family transcriptional regulator